MVTHQDYYQKIASLIADVPPQIVIVSMSHSFAEWSYCCFGVWKLQERKKVKYPRNLSLEENKELLSWQAPSLLVLDYLTLSISQEGYFFEICPSLNGIFRLHFHNYFDSFLASAKWSLSKSIFTPQFKYIILIDSLLLYSSFTRVLQRLRCTDHFLTVVSLPQLLKYRPTIVCSISV